MSEPSKLPLFRDIDADDPDPEATVIESLCLNCHEDGITRLLLTKIPFYKEVVLMSFSCEHCGFANNEIQPGGEIQEKGVRITLQVKSVADLNRQVVKSDSTSVRIPDLDFEIPPFSQKGGKEMEHECYQHVLCAPIIAIGHNYLVTFSPEITTVEGVIDRCIRGLQQDQEVRHKEHPEAAAQIDLFMAKLQKLKDVESPFSMVFDDISGNSFVQNPNAPHVDRSVNSVHYKRTKEQDHLLGIYSPSEVQGSDVGNESEQQQEGILRPLKEGEFPLEQLQSEVLQFPTNCPSCRAPCTTNMKLTNIPYFKEVVIMATNCDVCGVRTNEVKSGGGIEPKGMLIEIQVKSKEDFSRDVLKSDTCGLRVPELDIEVGPAALGGRFSTVEGILQAMKDQLTSSNIMFNDSADSANAERLKAFMEQFEQVVDGKEPVTLILDDPAGNSYVQSLCAPDPDPQLTISHYERTFEQNEELGLNDMKVDDYQDEETPVS